MVVVPWWKREISTWVKANKLLCVQEEEKAKHKHKLSFFRLKPSSPFSFLPQSIQISSTYRNTITNFLALASIPFFFYEGANKPSHHLPDHIINISFSFVRAYVHISNLSTLRVSHLSKWNWKKERGVVRASEQMKRKTWSITCLYVVTKRIFCCTQIE